jgi:hypothetical protein
MRPTQTKMSVVVFPGGIKLIKDRLMFTTAADCAPGACGTFTQPVPLALAEAFGNVNYSCWANQTGGGPYLQGVVITCYPLSETSFSMAFVNGTPNVILAGTEMNISYAALGLGQ